MPANRVTCVCFFCHVVVQRTTHHCQPECYQDPWFHLDICTPCVNEILREFEAQFPVPKEDDQC